MLRLTLAKVKLLLRAQKMKLGQRRAAAYAGEQRQVAATLAKDRVAGLTPRHSRSRKPSPTGPRRWYARHRLLQK
jgi:hypothetical protein